MRYVSTALTGLKRWLFGTKKPETDAIPFGMHDYRYRVPREILCHAYRTRDELPAGYRVSIRSNTLAVEVLWRSEVIAMVPYELVADDIVKAVDMLVAAAIADKERRANERQDIHAPSEPDTPVPPEESTGRRIRIRQQWQ